MFVCLLLWFCWVLFHSHIIFLILGFGVSFVQCSWVVISWVLFLTEVMHFRNEYLSPLKGRFHSSALTHTGFEMALKGT